MSSKTKAEDLAEGRVCACRSQWCFSGRETPFEACLAVIFAMPVQPGSTHNAEKTGTCSLP